MCTGAACLLLRAMYYGDQADVLLLLLRPMHL
jgi:hypothetical protein